MPIYEKFGYNPWPTQFPYQNLTPVGRTVAGLKQVITHLKQESKEILKSELLIRHLQKRFSKPYPAVPKSAFWERSSLNMLKLSGIRLILILAMAIIV